MSIPLWLCIPAVLGLWLSSWISLLDTTGSLQNNYIVWSATAIATVLLALRLARSPKARAQD